MLVDEAQSTDLNPIPELVKHACGGKKPAQTGELSPDWLFGQLLHQQIKRMGRGQHGQQVNAPKLRSAQRVPASAGVLEREQIVNEIIRHIIGHQVQQTISTHGGKLCNHAPGL